MLLSHFTLSGVGIFLATLWTVYSQARQRRTTKSERMSQEDSDSEVEVVLLHRSPRTRREFSNNSLENENRHVTNRYEPVIEDVNTERERVIILSSTESFHEDERDSGISEPAEEHLLPQLEVSPDGTRVDERERICSICIQVFIPFLIAGFGMLAAGLLLDAVQVSHSLCVVSYMQFKVTVHVYMFTERKGMRIGVYL